MLKRTLKGTLNVHCRWATRIDSRAPVSSARRVVQDGHQPRPLQLNATTRDPAQVSQVTSPKPNRRSPQVRYRSTSSFTRVGIAPDASGQPRRKASCTTDFSFARRRPSPASSTSPVYCPALTFLAGRRRGSSGMALAGSRPPRPPGNTSPTSAQRLLDGAEPLVFTSPLQRAAQTAKLALPGVKATAVDALMELDYGHCEGLRTSQIFAKFPDWDLFENGCPGGEKPHDFAARCDSFVDLLHRAASGRAVVAFTHGHLSRVLTARLLGLPVATAAALFNETASVEMINVHRSRWVLVGWNIC